MTGDRWRAPNPQWAVEDADAEPQLLAERVNAPATRGEGPSGRQQARAVSDAEFDGIHLEPRVEEVAGDGEVRRQAAHLLQAVGPGEFQPSIALRCCIGGPALAAQRILWRTRPRPCGFPRTREGALDVADLPVRPQTDRPRPAVVDRPIHRE